MCPLVGGCPACVSMLPAGGPHGPARACCHAAMHMLLPLAAICAVVPLPVQEPAQAA